MTTPLLRIGGRLLLPIITAIALWLLWRGHNAPGGGFIGALVGGVGVALVDLTTPLDVRRLPLPSAPAFLGAGLLLAIVTGLVPLLFADPFFESAIWTWPLPVIGDVKLVSSFFFDLGVFLIVIGLVRAILDALGDRPDAAPVVAERE